ncbi:MAG: sigma-70 family RNA polymerase sigma factor [Firmicutes bacterium]|nr:sigma-70 family RNA polymerase sigma factor [Bacillota bacterium]
MDEDLQVIEKFKRGDKDSFTFLINKYKKPVVNLIYRFTGNFRDSEDLAQEVFLRAYRGLDKFESRSSFFTWLYTITMNLCLRSREKENRVIIQSLNQKQEDGSLDRDMDALSQGNPVEESVEGSETAQAVRKAVMELPPNERMAVILHRYEDKSYEEIAEVLGISISAVKSRLHRARESLREKLEGIAFQKGGK